MALFFFEPVLNCEIIYIYIFAAYLLLCVKNSGKNVPYVPCSFSADLSLFYTLKLHAHVYHLPKVRAPIPTPSLGILPLLFLLISDLFLVTS